MTINADLKIGEFIHLLRRRKNLSVVGLSNMTGLSRNLISRIENGSIEFSLDTIRKILRSMDYIPDNALMTRVNQEKINSTYDLIHESFEEINNGIK